MASSSSSSCNWVYDVFPSFSGEDVRKSFLSHFLKELDRKLIIAFKDNEIERSKSLDPELKQAIRNSRIAVVVFSEMYASSSWCLEELMEIVKCKKESGQLVIPIFYGLDPSHVRKQTGKFGEAFAMTCQRKTEDETKLLRQSLTDVANTLGYHSHSWHSEAKMIEAIANDILSKLNITPPKNFEEFVGMEDHIAKMSVLLDLESEEVRMVGIWGTSGIGKTTIARALYSRLSHHFQGTVFIDRAFISNSTEIYKNTNPDDYNKKLHLVRSFLSEFLDKKDIRIDCLSAMEGTLKNKKVLIFIDDLDDQMVLDTLAGKTQWFGRGSRIIVVTKDKHFLRAHEIDYIYNVSLPSKELAIEMLCISAFKKNNPPEDMKELSSEVAFLAGYLPLGLKVLGSSLRDDTVEMHCLFEDMGKEIVRAQSNEPGEREFLVDSTDICNLFEDNTVLKGLEKIKLSGSKNLKEIPDLSMATNLKKLNLKDGSNLVEIPSSFRYLNKLEKLIMSGCTNLEALPVGINLQSLQRLDLNHC